jgi:hypothetical protein
MLSASGDHPSEHASLDIETTSIRVRSDRTDTVTEHCAQRHEILCDVRVIITEHLPAQREVTAQQWLHGRSSA